MAFDLARKGDGAYADFLALREILLKVYQIGVRDGRKSLAETLEIHADVPEPTA